MLSMSKCSWSLGLFLLSFAVPLLAQTTTDTAATVAEQDEATISGVIVRQLGNDIIEEHRVSGRTQSIRVVPQDGIPYLLLDTEGDGEVGNRTDQTDNDASGVTGWRIMNW